MEILVLLVLPLICSFVLAYILGKILIPILHRMKYGQSIREEGPQSHLKTRNTNNRWFDFYSCYNNSYDLIFNNLCWDIF